MAETMKKLDTMGNSQAPQSPNAPNGNSQQVVNVTYGHNGSGKLYSYYGSNKRAGDIVTPQVTHPKSGKVYKTLAVVRSTHKLPSGQDTVDYLNDKDIKMKKIGTTDQKSLPGYYPGWDKDAQAAYDLKMETLARDDLTQMQKISLMGEIRKIRK